jgi:hypothetical protein
MNAIAINRPNYARIWRAGLIAAVAAAAVNVVVALVAAAVLDVPADYRPLWPAAVALSTIFAVLVGTALYTLLARRSADRANRVFPLLAWGFAVLSLAQPLALLVTDLPMMEGAQDAGLGAVLATAVLHLVPAAIIVRLLTAASKETT